MNSEINSWLVLSSDPEACLSHSLCPLLGPGQSRARVKVLTGSAFFKSWKSTSQIPPCDFHFYYLQKWRWHEDIPERDQSWRCWCNRQRCRSQREAEIFGPLCRIHLRRKNEKLAERDPGDAISAAEWAQMQRKKTAAFYLGTTHSVVPRRLTKAQRLSADTNHPPQLPRGAGEQEVSREPAEQRLTTCLFYCAALFNSGLIYNWD